jgi:hypothetical protein
VPEIILEPKRDRIMGDFREFQNEELRNKYSSPNIIRLIKSRKMRWAKHAARLRQQKDE